MEEELEHRRTRTTARKSKKNDYLVQVMITQIVVCIAILSLSYGIKRVNPAAGAELRQYYDSLMAKDWNSEEAFAAFKKVGEFLLSPSDAWSNEVSQNGSGGVDIVTGGESFAAVKNTTFSPLCITAPITKPVEGRVTSRFGHRIHPITKKQGFHTGIDIAAPLGTDIAAAYDGIVEKIDESEGNGKYLIIRHDDSFSTVYCHCSEILVKPGASVRAGETVALVGQTGMATGPHLHFEVRHNAKVYNPEWISEF